MTCGDPNVSHSPQRADVFVGECNNHVAHVYARLARPKQPGDLGLRGRLRGPMNAHSATLPTNYPLVDLGPGDTTLARAKVPDPCTWSPTTPSLYEFWIEDPLGQVPPLHRSAFGIRQFGPRGSSLLLDARLWVPRGIHGDQATESLEVWREQAAVRVTQRFDAALFAEASRTGVMIVYEATSGSVDEISSLLVELADFAAVAMVLFPSGIHLPDAVRKVAPNVVLAQRVDRREELSSWAQVAWASAANPDQLAQLATELSLPIIVERRYLGDSLAAARAACDELQAELAPLGQFAGYVV